MPLGIGAGPPLTLGWSSASFEPRAQILLYDLVPPDTENAYVDMLREKGIPYDLWNRYYRETEGIGEMLRHYVDGVVMVTKNVPFDGMLLGDYLDEGGGLFVCHPASFALPFPPG